MSLIFGESEQVKTQTEDADRIIKKRLTKVPDAPGTERTPVDLSFGEAALIGMDSLIGDFVKSEGRLSGDVPKDGYNPFNTENRHLIKHTDEDSIDTYMKASNQSDVEIINRQLDRRKRDADLLSRSTVTDKAVAFGSAVFTDPLTFVPLVGAASKLRTGYKTASTLVKGSEEAITAAGILKNAVKSTSVTSDVVKGASIMGGAEAVSEGVRHAAGYDVTRTAEDSAFRVGAAATLNGLFSGVSKKLIDRKIYKWADDMETASYARSQAVQDPSHAVSILPDKFGRKISLSAGTDLAKSENKATRNTASRLMERFDYNEGNFSDIPTHTSVENKLWQDSVDLTTMNKQLKKLRRESDMSTDAFEKRVHKAQVTGIDDADAIINKAVALQKNFYKKWQDKMIDVGMMRPAARSDVEKLAQKEAKVDHLPVARDNYFPQSWKRDEIEKSPEAFDNLLVRLLDNNHPDMDPAAKMVTAQNTRLSLLTEKGSLKSLPDAFLPKPGSLQARRLIIPANLVDDFQRFLDTDIVGVNNAYLHKTAPEYHLQRSFGKDYKATIEDSIRADADNRIIHTPDPKEQLRIKNEAERDISKLHVALERVKGVRGIKDGIWEQKAADISTFVRKIVTMAMLSHVVLTSIPELAKPILQHGYAPFYKGLKQMAASMWDDVAKARLEDLERFGYYFEIESKSRLYSYMEMVGDVSTSPMKNSLTDKAMNAYGYATGITPWTAMMDKFLLQTALEDIIGVAAKVGAKGVVPEAKLAQWAMLGLDTKMIARIDAQIQKHGMKGHSTYAPNLGDWTDKEAVDALRGAMIKSNKMGVVRPTMETMPFWLDGGLEPIAKIVLQFMSFGISSQTKTFTSSMHNLQPSIYYGGLSALALAALNTTIRDEIYIRRKPEQADEIRKRQEEPGYWTFNLIDRSGLIPATTLAHYVDDFSDITQTMLRKGGMDVDVPSIQEDMFGMSKKAYRYSNKEPLDVILGPAAGYTQKAVKGAMGVIGDLANGREVSDKNYNNLYRVMPFNDVLPTLIPMLFDMKAMGDIARDGLTKGDWSLLQEDTDTEENWNE